MTQAVKDLLERAYAVENKSEELKNAIEALEFLGDDAKGSTQEYKDLKEILEALETEEQTEEQTEKINYAGVKQYGSSWRHKADNYTKIFATAKECALYFNEEK